MPGYGINVPTLEVVFNARVVGAWLACPKGKAVQLVGNFEVEVVRLASLAWSLGKLLELLHLHS